MINQLSNLALNTGVLKLGVVIVIILVGILLGRLAGRAIKRIMKEIELNKITQDLLKINLPIETLLSRIASWIIYVITILFALDQVGLSSTTLNIVLIFILAVIIILLLLRGMLHRDNK